MVEPADAPGSFRAARREDIDEVLNIWQQARGEAASLFQ